MVRLVLFKLLSTTTIGVIAEFEVYLDSAGSVFFCSFLVELLGMIIRIIVGWKKKMMMMIRMGGLRRVREGFESSGRRRRREGLGC